MRVNGLVNQNYIYAGQRLNLPGRVNIPAPQPDPSPSVPAPQLPRSTNPPTDGKWIDVDIGDQKITAYQGSTALKSVLVSTGVSYHPTVVGTFRIYTKIGSQTMSGGYASEYYYLPGVPWVMYFFQGYAIHGTYWHHNFGHPMSHGCVNLTIEDAKWFFNWAEIGTIVITHL